MNQCVRVLRERDTGAGNVKVDNLLKQVDERQKIHVSQASIGHCTK